ncbi:PQQ-binding-like beta-propeller repeat protein [Saccharibacillus sp. CPCC 101409]|uniref:outer membrane protein assembly factor BamB family protein n=1 Tax=Saccharibacillus sp. CPCC 101409 TaxID=3058041 RepID=UPI002673FADF|nr:PQQ-binding-like beta-propeller repeat protein [Saccharibacillus sp. CPCC 101409]MDO3411080.1 PQQ-binding-like beta-propeller repeat protein [Saccharibacillus sp. CPCC 101409]
MNNPISTSSSNTFEDDRIRAAHLSAAKKRLRSPDRLRRLSAALLAAALLFAPIAQASAGAELPNVSDVNSEKVRAAINGLLTPGAGEETVRDLLGVPFSVTDAPMNPPGNEPDAKGFYHWTDGGTEWRYEWPDAHLLVRFSDEGRLTHLKWLLPLTAYSQQDYRSWLQDEPFAPIYRPLTLTPSIKPELDWRTKIDVDYAYLEYADDDKLLVYGDDGGFSGGHYSSAVYLLDRASGGIVWQRELKLGASGILMDSTGQAYTSFADSNNDADETGSESVEHIRLNDGKVLWSYELQQAAETSVHFTSTADSVVLYRNSGKRDGQGSLIALDESTGRVKWKQQVRGSFGLLNERGDPFVLLAQGTALRALDPETGRTVWSTTLNKQIDIGGSAAMNPLLSPALDDPESARWVKFGTSQAEWQKVELSSGKILARYPYRNSEKLEDLGGGYLLVQKFKGDGGFYRSQASDLQTSLVDAASGRELWTLPGLIEHGKLEGETLYAVVNQIPSALTRDSGQTLWKARTNGFYPNMNFTYGTGAFALLEDYLLLPYNDDLLAFDKKTGEQIGRLDGFRFGYPETMETRTAEGLLNVQHGKLYVGSASGSFAVLDIAKLEKKLDEAQASGRGAPASSPQLDAARWYPDQPY